MVDAVHKIRNNIVVDYTELIILLKIYLKKFLWNQTNFKIFILQNLIIKTLKNNY